MFWGFPQRLRLQRWPSENQAPGAQKARAGGCSRALNAPREPIFWVRTHFSSQLWTNSVLTQNLIFWRVKDQFWLFWGPFWAPRASQRWEAQPLREASKHFWEIWMKWGSNLSLLFFQEQLRKLNFFENWDFHNLFTFATLSGWPCRILLAKRLWPPKLQLGGRRFQLKSSDLILPPFLCSR